MDEIAPPTNIPIDTDKSKLTDFRLLGNANSSSSSGVIGWSVLSQSSHSILPFLIRVIPLMLGSLKLLGLITQMKRLLLKRKRNQSKKKKRVTSLFGDVVDLLWSHINRIRDRFNCALFNNPKLSCL